MDIAEIVQNGGLVLSGAALVKLGSFVMKAWAARNQRTEISNDPLKVDKLDKYVTRGEFNKALERMERENSSAHENIFARLSRNDREYGEIKGLLTGLASDMQLIKAKLYKTRN